MKRQGVDLFEGREGKGETKKVIFTKFPMNTREGTHTNTTFLWMGTYI